MMDANSTRMAVFEEVNRAMRTVIVPRKPVDESVFIDWILQGTLPTGQTNLSGQLPIDRPALIAFMTYCFSAANAANQIQIGDKIYPVGNNTSQLFQSLDLQIVVYPKDSITITSAVGSTVFLNLQGHPISGVEYSVLK